MGPERGVEWPFLKGPAREGKVEHRGHWGGTWWCQRSHYGLICIRRDIKGHRGWLEALAGRGRAEVTKHPRGEA